MQMNLPQWLRPVPHAWTILKHAWSVRIMIAASLLMIMEPLISSALQSVTFDSVWINMAVALAIGLTGFAATWARVVFQQKLHDKLDEKERHDADRQNNQL
jgi:hypothetical protein